MMNYLVQVDSEPTVLPWEVTGRDEAVIFTHTGILLPCLFRDILLWRY